MIDNATNVVADLAGAIRETANKQIAFVEAKNEFLQAQLRSAQLEIRLLRLDLEKAGAQNTLLVEQLNKINEEKKDGKESG